MNKQKEKNGWKTLAIILLIICILLVLFVLSIIALGNELIEKEDECAINICRDYESYNFDYYEDVCYCFLDGEAVYSEYVR